MAETSMADVCVVGAGPVGGTLACRLASAGVETVLIRWRIRPSTGEPMPSRRVPGLCFKMLVYGTGCPTRPIRLWISG